MAAISDHFSILRDYFSQLYKDKSLCDLSLVARNGKAVVGHKLIVAAFSVAVRSEVNRWKDLPQVSIVLDCDESVLQCLLDFIYTGEVECPDELVPSLHQASVGLQVPSLTSYLEKLYGQPKSRPKRKAAQKVTNYDNLNSGNVKGGGLNIDQEETIGGQKEEVIQEKTPTRRNVNRQTTPKNKESNSQRNKEMTGSPALDMERQDQRSKMDQSVSSEKPSKRQKTGPGDEEFEVRIKEEAVTDEGSESSPCKNLRKRQSVKPKTLSNNDFDWLDDDSVNGCSDGDENDEDYDPSDEIDEKAEKTETTREISRDSYPRYSNGRFARKELRIELKRIDVENFTKKDKNENAKCKKSSRDRKITDQIRNEADVNKYTRENMSKLAKRKNSLKRGRKIKTVMKFSKEFKGKIKHSNKNQNFVSRSMVFAEKVKKFNMEPYKGIKKNHSNILSKNSHQYSCKMCSFSAGKLHDVRCHINKTHEKRDCWPRKRIIKVPKSKRKSMERIRMKTKNLQCFRCNRNLSSVRTLSDHLVEIHQIPTLKVRRLTGYPKYFTIDLMDCKCQHCNKEFECLKDLRAHCRHVHKMKRIEPDIPCSVENCTKKFLNRGQLHDHLANFHQLEGSTLKSHRKKIFRDPDEEDWEPRSKAKKSTVAKAPKGQMTKLKGQDGSKGQKAKPRIVYSTKEKSNIDELKRRRKQYRIFKPRKQYACLNCVQSTVCHYYLVNEYHKEVCHKKIYVSKLFESTMVIKKYQRRNFPTLEEYEKIKVSKPKTSLTPDSSAIPPSDVNVIFENGGLSDILSDARGQIISHDGLREKHKKKYLYICKKCRLTFSEYSSFYLHWRKKHHKFRLQQREITKRIKAHVDVRRGVYFRKRKRKDFKGPAVCQICKNTYFNLATLSRHLRYRHNYTPKEACEVTGFPSKFREKIGPQLYSRKPEITITCQVCHNTYSSPRQLAKHLQTVHNYSFEKTREITGYPTFIRAKKEVTESNYQCQTCNTFFSMKKDLLEHNVEAHGVQCFVCSKKFLTNNTLKKHGYHTHPEHFSQFEEIMVETTSREEEQEEEFLCEKCEFTTKYITKLSSHVMEHHPDVQHSCPECQWTFRNPYSLSRHIIRNHGNEAECYRKKKCLFCTKKFIRMSDLRMHHFKVHDIPHPDIKEFKCDHDGCKRVCYSVSSLRSHKKSHIENHEKNFKCTELGCNFIANMRHKVLRHVRTVHLLYKPSLCEHCGKAFSSAGHMKVHVQRLHSEDFNKFQCQHCDMKFGIRNALQTHSWHAHKIRMEDDTREYFMCDRCSFQTPLRGKFNNHMNKHDNIRNYFCDQCDAKFRTYTTMLNHIKWKHSNDELRCKHCDYKTKTKNRLNEHLRVQHQLKGVKPFKCIYCDFRSATGGNCRKHIKGRHKGQEVRYEVDREPLEHARKARNEGNIEALTVPGVTEEAEESNSSVEQEVVEQEVVIEETTAAVHVEPVYAANFGNFSQMYGEMEMQ